MNKNYRTLIAVVAVATTITISEIKSLANLPPLIPRQVLFGNPQKTSPQLSPDGKYLAYIAPDKNNITQIWVRTLGENDDRQITTDKLRGIQDYTWTYSKNKLIYKQDSNGDENWHLYLVDVNSKAPRDLTPFKEIQAQLVAVNPKFPNEVLVGINLKDPRKHDTYRINLIDGKSKLDTENSLNTVAVIPDRQFQIRAATATTSDGGSELLVRSSTTSPWKRMRKWGLQDDGAAINFSPDGKTLYIRSSSNFNTTGLSALNLATGKETVLARDSQYDLGDELFIHPTTRKIEAVSFYKQKLEWKILDEKVSQDFNAIAKVRRGEYRIVDRDLANKTWLIEYKTDDGPTYYYTYDRISKQSQLLFNNRPGIENLELAQTTPISYKSRDGLTIHGYITVPEGIPAKNLPTILFVHGGPWSRDYWGYDSWVQWMANRGYAVLQVNFRGSIGYGKKFLNAGDREWGGKMHNDLIDGVNWAVKEGIANPQKIGIMGGSYGGYATLAGLTFTPDVFAAGVSIVGPSNLITLLNSLPPYWESLKAMFRHRVGDLATEEDFLKSRSPLYYVNQIKAPLLIAQGANDPRVKQAESEQIVNALRRNKKLVEYVVYTDEGHGLVRQENSLHFTGKTEEFLGKHLGGRVEPASPIAGHSGISK